MKRLQLTFDKLPVIQHAHECQTLDYLCRPFLVDNTFAFVYITEGRWRFTLNDETCFLEPNSCFIKYPYLKFEGASLDGDRHSFLSVQVMRPFSSRANPAYTYSVPLIVHKILSPNIKELIRHTIYFNTTGDSLSAAGYFLKTVEEYANIKADVLDHDYKYIYCEKMIRYLDKNYAAGLGVSELAVHMGLSAPYCCQIFKQIMGCSIIHYLNQLRVSHAKELLLYGRHSLKDIARLVGIENYSYFCRIFRQYEGMSPQQFVQAHRTGRESFVCAIEKTPFKTVYRDQTTILYPPVY